MGKTAMKTRRKQARPAPLRHGKSFLVLRAVTGVDAPLTPHEESSTEFGRYRGDPCAFFREVLGWEPWSKQVEIAESVARALGTGPDRPTATGVGNRRTASVGEVATAGDGLAKIKGTSFDRLRTNGFVGKDGDGRPHRAAAPTNS